MFTVYPKHHNRSFNSRSGAPSIVSSLSDPATEATATLGCIAVLSRAWLSDRQTDIGVARGALGARASPSRKKCGPNLQGKVVSAPPQAESQNCYMQVDKCRPEMLFYASIAVHNHIKMFRFTHDALNECDCKPA